MHRAHANIVGVKDATANIGRVSEQRVHCGTDFIQLSGEDITALGFMAHGGQGCISVTANVAPAPVRRVPGSLLAGRFDEALAIQDKLTPLHKALFVEPSPAGAKYALSVLGKIEEHVRSPIVPLEEKHPLVRPRCHDPCRPDQLTASDGQSWRQKPGKRNR